jgi:ABC-type spermidine/putrescine transport system permease subunit I
VVIGLVNASLPFAVFPIHSVLERIPVSLREGCAHARRAAQPDLLVQIVFPLSLPGVAASVVIVFLQPRRFAPLMLGGGFADLISPCSPTSRPSISRTTASRPPAQS